MESEVELGIVVLKALLRRYLLCIVWYWRVRIQLDQLASSLCSGALHYCMIGIVE